MRYIIFLLCVVGLAGTVLAQDSVKVDSLQSIIAKESNPVKYNTALLDLAKLYINSNRSKSDSLSSLVLEYGRQNEHLELHTQALSLLGRINYKDQKDHQALIYYTTLDSILSVHNIKNILLLKSKLYQSQIAKFSYTEEGVERMKELLDEMLDIAQEINSDHYEHIAYLNIGSYYGLQFRITRDTTNLPTQRVYYLKALDYFLEKKDAVNISKSYWFLSDAEKHLGNLDGSEQYLLKRAQVLKNTGKLANLGNAYNSLGGFNYRYSKNYQRAIMFYDSAMSLYQKEGFTDSQFKLDILNGYSLSYKELGQFEQAFEYLDKAYLLKDSLERNRISQATIEFETKYQAQKKEQEIQLLTAQNELAEREKRNQLFILIIIVASVMILAIFLYILYRNRQKTANKLKELDKIKSNFFANISHEFRTPLTLIKSPVEARLNDGPLAPEERNQFESISRNADRLLSLVDQLLDLSQLESGSMKLNVERASLGSFLEASIASFEYIAMQKKITYDRKFDCKYDDHWFDKDVVEKIVVNLVSNAFKYTPENGEVNCSLTCTNNQAVISVSNTGNGIKKEELERLFERFYQVDSSKDGVGIGLALVKELVQLHHGSIDFTSGENRITFSVQFPINESAYKKEEFRTVPVVQNNTIVQSSVTENADVEDTEVLSDNPIMLVVEDNQEVRKLVSGLFEDHYVIIEAENGEEGIERAIQYIPDIIISDVMMPKIDGIELAETLKLDERTSHIPIILLTARAGEKNTITGLETGADDYIIKPFNNEVLKVRVKKLTELRAQLRQRYSQEVILRPKDIAISSADEKFLERLQELLDQRLTDPDFNAEAFSKEIGMSRMQLHRKLKALIGLTTTEFIRSQRLKLAAHLLESSEINMSEVGYSVGFNDPSYFAKCFKETYDCTPKQYAAINKSEP